MDYTIRDMTPEDIPAVMIVARLLHGPQGWFDEAGLAWIAIDLGFHRGWVAVRDGQIVGFLTAFTYEGIGHLAWMGVSDAVNRRSPQAIEMESTFRMLRLKKLMGVNC